MIFVKKETFKCFDNTKESRAFTCPERSIDGTPANKLDLEEKINPTKNSTSLFLVLIMSGSEI